MEVKVEVVAGKAEGHVKRKRAASEMCVTCGVVTGSFKIPGTDDGSKWCARCKPSDAVTVNPICETCHKTHADFNHPQATGKPRWCEKCKPEGTVHVYANMCECGKRHANFNLPGVKPARWCALCKEPDAINVNVPRCACGSGNVPSFNMREAKGGKWCSKCKPRAAVFMKGVWCECGESHPTFGQLGQKPQYCAKCRPKDVKTQDVRNRNRKCECGKGQANYNLPGEKRLRWCALCREPGAVDLTSKKCELCKETVASFNEPGQTGARWCSKCKPASAIDVKSSMCVTCGLRNASFSDVGERTAKYCAKCKPAEAQDAKGRMCIKCAKKHANFGMTPGGKNAQWCATCKPPGAVDVKRRRCQCGKAYATFRKPKERAYRWCKECKPVDAVNKKSGKNNMKKACSNQAAAEPETERAPEQPTEKTARKNQDNEETDTERAPVQPTKTKARKTQDPDATAKVKKEEAAEPTKKKARRNQDPDATTKVKKKEAAEFAQRCACGKNEPQFYAPGDHSQSAQWCDECPTRPANALQRNKQMLLKRCMCQANWATFSVPGTRGRHWCAKCKPEEAICEDVSKKSMCDCGEIATLGLPGFAPTLCATCPPREFHVPHPCKQCKKFNCKELALFGITDRMHCEKHRELDEKNLVERPCVSCGLAEILDEAKKCSNCDPVRCAKFVKRKEDRIRRLFDSKSLHYAAHDTIIDAKCGKERPDFVFEYADHVVIVEVDEFAHASYPCECEQMRMVNITQAFGGTPVLWIRYNPDQFIDIHGNKPQFSPHVREVHLLNWLSAAAKRSPAGLCEVVYLFYPKSAGKAAPEDIAVVLPFQ